MSTNAYPGKKILHVLTDGADELSGLIIAAQAQAHEVHVVNLRDGNIPYQHLVDEIFAHDQVISW